MRQANAAGIGMLCVLVFVAAFMAWGSFRAVPNLGAPLPDGVTPPEMTFDITGWNGHLDLFGLRLPNWLVVVAALAVGVMGWLRTSGTAEPPSGLAVTLCAYCALHSLIMNAILALGRQGAVGVGGVITTLASIGMLVLWVTGTRVDTRPVGQADYRDYRATPQSTGPYPGGNLDQLRAEERARAARAEREHAERP